MLAVADPFINDAELAVVQGEIGSLTIDKDEVAVIPR